MLERHASWSPRAFRGRSGSAAEPPARASRGTRIHEICKRASFIRIASVSSSIVITVSRETILAAETRESLRGSSSIATVSKRDTAGRRATFSTSSHHLAGRRETTMYEFAKRSRNTDDSNALSAATEIADARDRALSFILEQRADASKSADGRALGIQAKLSRSLDGENAIALEEFVPGVALDATAAPRPDDPLNGVWLGIVSKVCEMLGFPLEPELFSNMLVVAQLSRVDHPTATRLADDLTTLYRDTSVDGLYHFFSSLRFACDIDCTAVGVRSRLAVGDLRFDDAASRAALRRSTHRILGSAAVADVPREANRSHGKENGPLQRLV